MAGDPFKVDMGEWRALTRRLQHAAPSAYTAVKKAMGPAMKPVAEEARSLAGFSDKIPESVVSGSRGAVGFVQAGGSKAPDAAPFEHQGRPGRFRHPVFARGDRAKWTWVNQKARPFLHPAAEHQATKVADILTKAVTDAIADELSK